MRKCNLILSKKVRVEISKKDALSLEMQSDLCRCLYNAALEQRIIAFERGKSLHRFEQQKELPNLKKEMPEFAKVYNKYLQCTIQRVDKSFRNFYRRCKEGSEEKGFPRYRGKDYFFTLDCPGDFVKVKSNIITLPFKIKVKALQPIPEKFGEVHISKQNGNWFVIFTHEVPEAEINGTGLIAIDLGIKNLVSGVSSETGTPLQIKSRKPSGKELKRMDALRSKRDKCNKRSIRWHYLSKRLHQETAKWQRRTADHLHKVSHFLTNQTARILVIGKLVQSQMLTQNSALNRQVQNEWKLGAFVSMLKYKCKKFGKILVEVDEAYTTQDCFQCGNRVQKTLAQRVHDCPCGFKLDRDFNSALNIMKKFVLGHSHESQDSCFDLNKIKNLLLQQLR